MQAVECGHTAIAWTGSVCKCVGVLMQESLAEISIGCAYVNLFYFFFFFFKSTDETEMCKMPSFCLSLILLLPCLKRITFADLFGDKHDRQSCVACFGFCHSNC